jgi:hypothetical protein
VHAPPPISEVGPPANPPRRHQPLPVHLFALLGPLLCPEIRAVCSGSSLSGFLRTTSTLRLIPSCAHHHTSSSFAPAASLTGVYLQQVREAEGDRAQIPAAAACCWHLRRRPWRCEPWLRVPDLPCQRAAGGACYLGLSLHPVVSSLLLSPTPVVLADCKSTIPDTRMGLPPQALPQTFPQTLAPRRTHLSHVPSIRHLPKPAVDCFSRTGTRGAPSSMDNRSSRYRSWRRVSGGRCGPSGVLACWGGGTWGSMIAIRYR